MTASRRSQPTRERILREARRLFAEQGFERTTIRAIAAAAEINPSLVIRYHGSKEELFAAAAHIDLRIPDIAAKPAGERGEALVAHFLDRWEGPDAGDELPALMRAAATHEAARQRVIEITEAQVRPVVTASISAERRAERLGLIVSQMAGLAVSRYVLAHPAVTALDRDTIIREVGAIVQRLMSE